MLYAQGIVRFGISLPNTQAFCFQIWRSLCFCTQRPFERYPTVLLIFAILFYYSFIGIRISRINILLSHFPISPMTSCSSIFYASVFCSAFPKMIFTKDISFQSNCLIAVVSVFFLSLVIGSDFIFIEALVYNFSFLSDALIHRISLYEKTI